MADEDVATPALEPQASEPQQVETPELETEVETEGEPLGEDEDELEFGFKKYRVPKELKTAVEDLRADATNKHKDAAARQKALDDREASIKQQAEVSEAEIEARAQLHGVKKELERLKDFDFAAFQHHHQLQPMQATELWNYKQSLQNQSAELEGELGKATNERTQRAQSDLTKRVEQTLAEAPKIIGSAWKGAETIQKVAKFLNEEIGIPETTITQNWSPALLRLGHLAGIGLELTKKAAAKPATVAVTPEPLRSVRTNSTPQTGLSDNLSAEEWVKRRDAQVRKRH